MGMYLNPGNEAFQEILNREYVDKTELIAYINDTIQTPDKYTCFSRPRRFGKSFAAMMLAAYYDRTCDSHHLFEHLKIAQHCDYEKHLNQYNVIYLDMIGILSAIEDKKKIVPFIQKGVIRELQKIYPEIADKEETILAYTMSKISQETGIKFVVIIDEWDAVFREVKYDEFVQKEYIQLLRSLFKSGPVTRTMIAAAYMTGILPIKKYGTQSALTDFIEYTMTDPGNLAKYIGFTEDEVKCLCEKRKMDYYSMKQWYDGYSFSKAAHIYSPNSVMKAIQSGEFKNYWAKSETYESLKDYISMNFDGLKDAVITMLGGGEVYLDTLTFQNDFVSLKSRDDVLTLLIHLGYLAYDEQKETVHIPNLEVAESFKSAVQNNDWGNVSEAIRKSNQLLEDTIAGNEEEVAEALDDIHSDSASVLQYNNENSLSCAITIAYYTARKEYQMIREFPTGKGFADIIFLPYKNVNKPAILIELKYNQSADSAIRQIKERRYEGILKEYAGNVLLVGINYDKNSKNKKHTCMIEKI